MTDVDVKARLETLTRRLDAERIRRGFWRKRPGQVRDYGRESEAEGSDRVAGDLQGNGVEQRRSHVWEINILLTFLAR